MNIRKRYNFSTNKAIPGQTFGYAYDDIGNLTTEQRGMTEMQYSYTANLVNQYTQRLVPGIIPVTGQASATSTVTVWLKNHGENAAAVIKPTRDGEYFKAAIPVNNSAANVTEALEITAVKFNTTLDKDVVKIIDGSYTVPKTPQLFTYDDDGNLLSDGVWTYTWNGENRVVAIEQAGKIRLEFKYDYQGRRIEQKIYSWVNNAWNLSKYLQFVYDGYKQIAEYDGSAGTMQKNYTWQPGSVGQDIPLWLLVTSGSIYYYAVDGNKNIRAMIDGSGNVVAEYEYGPFGEILSKYGVMADNNPFRFSAEFFDAETGLIYYNYRYYSPELRRWLSRDPIGEGGGYNLYCFIKNSPLSKYDLLGAIAVKPILTEPQCQCAYEQAYAIFDDFRRKNPPDEPLNPWDGWGSFFVDRHDCNWGATEIEARLVGNSNVARAFGLSVARGGKFSTFSYFPPLYSEIDKSWYRFVRMHSVTALKPQNGCEKYYTETVFDYMNGLAYGLSEFQKEYNLNETFDFAGYYAVENNNTNVLRPGQKSPKSVAELVAEQ